MKEALVNYVEAVSDKVQNVGQCKMAASAVTSLTEGEISMKTRVGLSHVYFEWKVSCTKIFNMTIF